MIQVEAVQESVRCLEDDLGTKRRSPCAAQGKGGRAEYEDGMAYVDYVDYAGVGLEGRWKGLDWEKQVRDIRRLHSAVVTAPRALLAITVRSRG
ncbi:hypothetical protein Tdes44962_MAKER01905 [Teratosphaeria destructans]|uniref:Uncharacterized protein n=1 Tax=Teratosphaeria destructans TaxID=418781 RepID=A0A9W7SWE4_9PEZI|nr:hypothetical protein Tdes44962_MAKER01905 [Teratosphaeria destructans]